jgi:alpha-beta hydrolase superfamily lysophospholipase
MVRWGEALAAAGFPVLRFDYAGTGDAPGSDEEPGRVPAWIASVHAAIEAARRLSGAPRVALAGLHLGGTLAAQACADRSDVEALVAWAPFRTGRAYVRQVRAYRLLNVLPEPPDGATAGTDEEAAGYRLTRSTVAELESLDLCALARAPAPRVLLLSRDEKVDDALAGAWKARGAAVSSEGGSGWQEMMQQPRKSVVPEQVLGRTVAFLAGAAGSRVRAATESTHPDLQERSWIAGPGVVEEAFSFGDGGMMAGVLTRPGSGSTDALPTVLFLTTASHQHIGPNRLWVRLARDLSGLGLQTLRFDLTGVGDSVLLPGESPTHAYSTESVPEVREAMDALQRFTGARRFVLVGLCSGAYLAYHSAVQDPRVVGVVGVNPQTLIWKEGDSLDVRHRQTLKSMGYYRRALVRGETWRKAMKGDLHLRQITQVLVSRGWRRLLERTRTGPGEETDVGRGLRALVERGTDVYFLFGADDEGVDALGRQAGPAVKQLSRSPAFKIEVVEGPSHTFEQIWAQDLLAACVVGRLSKQLRLGTGRSAAG